MSGMGELFVHFEGFPYVLAGPGITSISGSVLSHDDYPDGATLISDALDIDKIQGWTERMDILDGKCTVDSMRFTINDLIRLFNGEAKPFMTYMTDRDEEELASTVLTANMTVSDLSFFVGDGNVVDPFMPGVLWIDQEAILCDSVDTGTGEVTVNASGRGYLGTRAAKHSIDEESSYYPEVWCEFPWVFHRKCCLWFAEQTGTITSATVLWRGYATKPERNADGQWIISADSIVDRTRQARLGAEGAVTQLRGFDRRKALVRVNWHGAPGWGIDSGAVRSIYNTLQDLVNAIVHSLNTNLDNYETSGTILFIVSGAVADGGVKFSVYSTGVNSLIIQIEQFGSVTAIHSPNITTSDPKTAVIEFHPAPTALVVVNQESSPIPISSTNGLLNTSAIDDGNIGYRTAASFFLRGEYPDGDTYLVIRPSQDAPVNDNDSAVNGPSYTGTITLEPKDPNGQTAAQFTGPEGNLIETAVPLRQVARVSTNHWYAGLQLIMSSLLSDFIGTEIDSRDWTLTFNEQLISITNGPYAGREYYLDGTTTLGDLLENELPANGCGLAVRSQGRLRIVPLRQPTPNQVVVTIAEDDLLSEAFDNQKLLNNGQVVNSVQFKAPGIEINVPSRGSQGRYGQGRRLEVDLQHLRVPANSLASAKEIGDRALTRLLTLFSHPRKLISIEVPWLDYYTQIFTGTWISYTSGLLPDGHGNIGASNVIAQVIERTCEVVGVNKMTLKVMVLRPVRGYSVCLRVADFPAADTIQVATGYIDQDSSDYSGSSLSTYPIVTEDGGTYWIAVGDVLSLILRDSTTDTRELGLVVASINTIANTITFVDPIPTSPFDWVTELAGGAIIDARYDKYNDVIASQQAKFAWIGSNTDGFIDGTDDRVLEWAG